MQRSNGRRQQLPRNVDDKVFSRQLTKESSAANTSSRIFYYGGAAGSVPFRWESSPGTPKHPSSSCTSLIPSLTPPPSYHAKILSTTPDSGWRSKPKVVRAILSKLSMLPASPRRSCHISPASSVSSSSSSSSSIWSLSSPSRLRRGGQGENLSWKRFPLKFELEDNEMEVVNRHQEEEDELDEYFRPPSPTSTLSFRTRRSNSTSTGSRFRGCYPVKSVRNRLFSIIGHQGSV
ncbi:uncharacterized protein LOC116187319 [Punica granatum]|uniref:Uncharacterized protein n=2 Tax=Punica granatum TaxID=22663 RepID=A0A218XQY9_PUNGR|nr:uncharacterized protein LOC116187319 [Punica granatum]OWM87373.1 hypothetical protein CDL15_Pgr022484 [Punica granatum]PKI34432.1 hypothetical protein CRG98_045178 [Punica granatum]